MSITCAKINDTSLGSYFSPFAAPDINQYTNSPIYVTRFQKDRDYMVFCSLLRLQQM